MRPVGSDIALRRCVFAISVLDDFDVLPLDDGVTLGGVPPIRVPWDELWLALGTAAPESLAGRERVAAWLQQRRWLADRPHAELRELARPVGLPVGHFLHPGVDWPRDRILGDALDAGIGLLGLDPARPDDVIVVPTPLLRGAGIEPKLCWHDARLYLERMATLAVQRWRRSPTEVLRPMGDCDVITLLCSRTLRAALCADTGGMRAIVAPMRTRGWVDLSRIDPAFAIAAAAASQPEDCGFPRGLLITADEVVMVQPGGRPQDVPLRDPGVGRLQHLRPVLYHR
ncbi:MAG: hypothetical protein ABI912_04170 [Actinomycetota bacterium]